jgi:DNA-directed RNA polymerase specialized sigma24 family protein
MAFLLDVGEKLQQPFVMARAIHNNAGSSDPEAVPPFWLPTEEDADRQIDPRVVDVARENWAWAFYLIKREINDGTRTREIVQDVAIGVTSRLREETEVGRNLHGYYRTSVIHHVKALAISEGRITYEGSAQDLERNHRPSAPDWLTVFEDRMILQAIAPYMSHPVRQILHNRQLDYSWEETARRLGLTEKQAKSRFYYGARRAYERLLKAQARRARAERDRSHGRD